MSSSIDSEKIHRRTFCYVYWEVSAKDNQNRAPGLMCVRCERRGSSAADSGVVIFGFVLAKTAGAEEDKLVVYGIYKAGDQTWFIGEGAVAQKAVEEAGGEFIYVDAKMNPEEYLKAIDNAVANHASGDGCTSFPQKT